MRFARSLSVLLLSALPSPAGAEASLPATIHVPGDRPTIQSAIDAASDGDLILVSPGVYPENVSFLGKAVRVEAVGGPASTTIDGGGRASTVSFVSGEGPGSELIGFTVRGGAGDPVLGHGGGILCTGTAPTVRGCVIRDNEAQRGAGVYLESSPALLEDCVVRDNEADEGQPGAKGGGVYMDDAGAVLRRCTLSQNLAYFGGGVWGIGTLEACVVTGNSATYGGGIYTSGALTAEDCTISGNAAGYQHGRAYGGGVAGPATLRRCVISGNTTVDRGGGVYAPGGNSSALLVDCLLVDNEVILLEAMGTWGGGAHGATLLRCVVAGNRCDTNTALHPGKGGGIWACEAERCVIAGNRAELGAGAGQSDLTHCSLYGNLAVQAGGGYWMEDGTRTVTHSILWGDHPEEIVTGGGTLNVTYSDVQGGWPGTGNIAADPLYVAPALEDLYLTTGSPCIDAGDPSAPPDPDGSVADIGAFFFETCPSPEATCVPKWSSGGCVPAIGWTGTPTLSGPDDFFVTADRVPPGRFGLLVWSRALGAQPFHGGTLCLAAPLMRTPAQSSGGTGPCTGSFSFHFTQADMTAAGLAPGDAVLAQWWYRDPDHLDGTGIGLSAALRARICP